jgi:hypothetical protein
MQAMDRKRHRLGAWSLVFLMGLWLLGQAQAADAALQQPIALPTAELRRKLRDRELPTYVIEWVMPGASRSSIRTPIAAAGASVVQGRMGIHVGNPIPHADVEYAVHTARKL